jgi:AcrR family transcriptional regulator
MTPDDFLLSIPKQDRARAALTRILDAGRLILASDGLAALTTDEIARRAEVNIATFYKYFANREGLLGYLALQFSGEQTRSLLACIAGFNARASWRSVLPALIDTMVQDWERVPGSRILQGVFLVDPRLQEEYARSSIAVSGALKPFAPFWGFQGTDAEWLRIHVVFGDCLIALLDRAAKSPEPERDALIGEMKSLAIAYHATRLTG